MKGLFVPLLVALLRCPGVAAFGPARGNGAGNEVRGKEIDSDIDELKELFQTIQGNISKIEKTVVNTEAKLEILSNEKVIKNVTVDFSAANVTETKIATHLIPEFSTSFVLMGVGSSLLLKTGFIMRHSGLCSLKNTMATVMMNVFDLPMGMITWYTLGHGWTFGDDEYPTNEENGLVGTSLYMDEFLKDEMSGEGNYHSRRWARFLFFFGMCMQSYTIISGAVLGRITLLGYLTSVAVYAGGIWPMIAHSIWNDNGFFSAYRVDDGIGQRCGAIDHAGSGVVHMAGGMAAFATLVVIKERKARYKYVKTADDKYPRANMMPIQMASQVYTVLGGYTILIFNIAVQVFSLDQLRTNSDTCGTFFGELTGDCRSVTMESYDVPYSPYTGIQILMTATMNTIIAALSGSVAALFWGVLKEIALHGRFTVSVELGVGGLLAGMASIAAGAPFYNALFSSIIGAGGGFIYLLFGLFSQKMFMFYGFRFLGLDDTSTAVSIHGWTGVWGMIAVGLFAFPNQIQGYFQYFKPDGTQDPLVAKDICGGLFVGAKGDLLGAQISFVCFACTIVWLGVGLTLGIVAGLAKIRIGPAKEMDGIDRHDYGGLIPSLPLNLGVTVKPRQWIELPSSQEIKLAQRDCIETTEHAKRLRDASFKLSKSKQLTQLEKDTHRFFGFESGLLVVKKGLHKPEFMKNRRMVSNDAQIRITDENVMWIPPDHKDMQHLIMCHHRCRFPVAMPEDANSDTDIAEAELKKHFFWETLDADWYLFVSQPMSLDPLEHPEYEGNFSSYSGGK